MSEIIIKPNVFQTRALHLLSDPKIEVLGIGGGKGSSKSTTARIWIMMRMLKYENARGLIIRKSFDDLTRTFVDKIKQEYAGVFDSYNSQTHTFHFSNGSQLELAYLDNDSDVDRFFGAEKDSIIIDEMQQLSQKVFEILRTSLRTNNPLIKPRIVLTWNWSGKSHNFLKRLFWDKVYDYGQKPEHYAFLFGTIRDNPDLMEADPGYIERLEALPEAQRKLYLLGDPNSGIGTFFSEFTTKLAEEPFVLTREQMKGNRLIGGLDCGTSHATSFGLWWTDSKQVMHKLFTYLKSGLTMSEHAENIYNAIAGFKWTDGFQPSIIFTDPAAWTKGKLNPYMVRSTIDEYQDYFAGKNSITKFERANNDKVYGCGLMRKIIKERNLRYFRGYNKSFEEAMLSAMTDKNNIEVYDKTGDSETFDLLDQSRYAILGAHSQIVSVQQKEKLRRKLTDKEKVLAGHFSPKSPDGFYENDLKYI